MNDEQTERLVELLSEAFHETLSGYINEALVDVLAPQLTERAISTISSFEWNDYSGYVERDDDWRDEEDFEYDEKPY